MNDRIESNISQVGLFNSPRDAHRSTELCIDPQCLQLWNPVKSYSELAALYDTKADVGQEDIQ